MTFGIDVRADLREVRRDLRRLRDEDVPRAAATALNRTNRRVRTAVVRKLAGDLGVRPQRRIRRRVLIPRGAGFRATRRHLVAGGLVLLAFVPEIWTIPSGARARRAAQGANKFIATMPSGHTGLFRRRGNRRLPIAEYLLDLSVRARTTVDRVLESDGARFFRAEFERAGRRIIER